MLLASVATTLAGVALPHLSHDWEAGRKQAVADRINLMLKLLAIALTAGALVVLLAGPLVFDVLFRGKYPGGLAVLPGTLACCVWIGLFATAFNYLWCAERAGLGSFVVLLGLAINIGLNLWLIPRMGLRGAVLATSVANLMVLVGAYSISGWLGMRLDRGMLPCLALPLVMYLEPWGALLAFATAAWLAARTPWVFNPSEREQLRAIVMKARSRWLPGVRGNHAV
jgi:polysaccharide transporter, PST family